MKKYALKYDLTIDSNDGKGFTKEEIDASLSNGEDFGACDALFFVSIIRPEDGSFSISHFSFDGQNGSEPISKIDLFKIFGMLSKELKDTGTYDWQRSIAEETFNRVRDVAINRGLS